MGFGPLEEKVSLYADDTLLYLQDMDSSLRSALVLFDEFGRFSGLLIGPNWSFFLWIIHQEIGRPLPL